MSESKRRPISAKKKAGFALIVLLIFAGGAELCLRVAGYPKGVVRSFSKLWNPDQANAIGLFRPGKHMIGYPRELAYGVRINALGLRGDEIALKKPQGTKRVLVLGDSLTFGYYVEDDATPSAILQAKLRAQGETVEVINGGCGHFSMPDELLYLEERLLRLDLDAVVLIYCGNDVGEKELNRTPTLYEEVVSGKMTRGAWLRSTAIGEAQLMLTIRIKQWRRERSGDWPPKSFSRGDADASEAQWARYGEFFGKLKALLDAKGLPLVVVSYTGLGPVEAKKASSHEVNLIRLTSKHGVPLRVAREAFSATPDPRKLYHWPLDPHTTAAGNSIFADLAIELLQGVQVIR